MSQLPTTTGSSPDCRKASIWPIDTCANKMAEGSLCSSRMAALVDPSNFDNLIQAVAPFHAANIELHGVGVQPPPKLRDSGDHFTLLKGFADLGRYREFETLKDASALLHHILQIARTDTGPK